MSIIPEAEIAEARALGLVEVDGKWVKPNKCDYCGEIAEHDIHAGDETLSLCDGCYEHTVL